MFDVVLVRSQRLLKIFFFFFVMLNQLLSRTGFISDDFLLSRTFLSEYTIEEQNELITLEFSMFILVNIKLIF